MDYPDIIKLGLYKANYLNSLVGYVRYFSAICTVVCVSECIFNDGNRAVYVSCNTASVTVKFIN